MFTWGGKIMPCLSLSFMGTFQASLDGQLISSFEADKVRALLAYLAVEADRPHRRDALTSLLWPDWPDRSARTSLRNALSNLRSAINDRNASTPYLLITRETIQFNLESDHWLDVEALKNLIKSDDPLMLEEGLNLYRGNFLEGFQLKDSSVFEEWHLFNRERLLRTATGTIRRLVSYYHANGEIEKACQFAWRMVELQPWSEEGYQRLMVLLAQSGQRSTALAQYEICRRQLALELGVEPSPETTRLYEHIRDGEYKMLEFTTFEEFPPAPGSPPYKGLQFFTEADADLFFGRELVITKLVSQLNPVKGDRFLAIVGASGSGKSSIIRAGLIPALKRGLPLSNNIIPPDSSSNWPIVVITPTNHPLEALAMGLTQGDGSLTDVTKFIDDLKSDVRSLYLHICRNLPKTAEYLLLVVDQFEELFTQCKDKIEQQAFLDNVMTTVQLACPVVIVIALRADFYPHCGNDPKLREALEKRQVYIGPMNTEELRRAITEPARKGKWTFEPGLVDLMIQDVESEPGALPLLSHALLETWKRRRGRMLTLAGYTESGGVRGAIAQTAERILQRLDPNQKLIARNIFLRLTELGEATQETRRRARLGEFAQGVEDEACVEQVMKILVDARLVVTSRDSAEVAHEALIREWPTLRNWLEEDQEGIKIHRHLTVAALEWERLDRDPGELYRGSRLATADGWTLRHADDLNPLEREFLAASQKLAAQKELERQNQIKRELEAARNMVELERQRAVEQARSARRLRGRAVWMAVVSLIALILAGFALFARSSAQREAEVNRSLVLAELALEANESGEVDKALALGLEGVNLDEPPPDAISKLAVIAKSMGTRAVLAAHSGAIQAAVFSPDGRFIISGGCVEPDKDGNCFNGELILWDLPSTKVLARFPAHQDWITALVWRPDSQEVLSGGADGRIILWNTVDLTAIAQWNPGIGPISALAISPDGLKAAAGANNSLILFEFEQGQISNKLQAHTDEILDLTFSPDGKFIATGSADATIVLWDVAEEQSIRTLEGHISDVTAVAFLPDGQQILSASSDFTHRLWDVTTGAELKKREWGDTPDDMALSPDGKTVLHYDDHVIYTWNLEQMSASHQKLLGHVGYIYDVTINADGSLALSVGSDGTLRIWNLQSAENLQQIEIGVEATAMGVAPDGKNLAIGGWNEKALVWDLESLKSLFNLPGNLGIVSPGAIAYSPNGLWIAGASGYADRESDEHKLIIWDAATGNVHCDLHGHTKRVRTVSFSPDSRYAISGSQGVNPPDELILWDVSNCRLEHRFSTTQDTTGIDFTSDGKFLVTSSAFSENVLLWNFESREVLHEYLLPGEVFLDTIFGPDDNTILGGTLSGLIVQWETEKGKQIRNYFGHDGGVWSLAISPDVSRMVSSDDTGTIILWDLITGAELRRHNAHQALSFQVGFSPDGETIYSVSADETLVVWQVGDLSLAALRSWIENNRYVRELTCEEREQYKIKPLCDK